MQTGTLYVVGVPIGNLADISARAKSVLGEVDTIACEDTRETGKLCSLLEIDRKNFLPYHDKNEAKQAGKLVQLLLEGKNVALVSDAGMPCLSDPGFRVVRECRKSGIRIEVVPGPVAFTAALAGSGLPTDGCLFVGFLPPKSAARKRFFEKYESFDYTIAFYESCHRIEKFVNDAIDVFGSERVACIARELTKRYETFMVGPLAEVKKVLLSGSQKGEFVVLLAPDRFKL